MAHPCPSYVVFIRASILPDGFPSAPTLLKQVHDRRFSFACIRRRISIDLPRPPSGLPPVRRHSVFDRFVRFVHAVVRPAVDGNGSFAPGVSVAYTSPAGSNVRVTSTPKSHSYRHARLRWVMVEEDVVAVSPKPRLTANEIPDLAQGRPPRRAHRAQGDLAPHRGQLAGVNNLYADGDGHSSILNQNRDGAPVNLRHLGYISDRVRRRELPRHALSADVISWIPSGRRYFHKSR